MDIQTIYQETIKFAAAKHADKNQTIPGTNLPYVVHLSNVAMEILMAAAHSQTMRLDFAVRLALLHDTLEDTDTSFEELKSNFGLEVAEGVAALTKNDQLPKSEKMADSLNRIRALAPEVWAVKLADRITNMQTPPRHWDSNKRHGYLSEAKEILRTLEGANEYLEKRLSKKTEEYKLYL